jgi:lysophospholipase L1-like esterase
LVIDGLARQGVKVTGIFAGVSGHKSNQMLSRLERDVLSKKPDWMTLSCGVNDVWHGATGVPLNPYKTNITAIVDQAQAAGVKVMILTATMIKEDPAGDLNQQLIPYNAFLRELVAKGCLLADLNAEMQAELETFPEDAPRGKRLTRDGVHMNAYGNFMMAKGILKAFGVSETSLPSLVQAWRQIPGSTSLRLNMSFSLDEHEALEKKLDGPVKAAFEQFLNEKKEALLQTEE